MKDFLEKFVKRFAWYRGITIGLLKQLPADQLNERISERSLPMRLQIVDLGDVQLQILEMLTGKIFKDQLERPDPETGSVEEIEKYLNECQKIFAENVVLFDDENKKISWFDRMDFDYQELLTFLQAHEAMHHGEILSFVYAKGIPMPQVLKETWGFERNSSSS